MKLWKSLMATVLLMIMLMAMGVSAGAYSDVSAASEYADYIALADKLGIMPATTQGDFNPHDYFTRGDAIVALYRMLHGSDEGITAYKSGEELFTDISYDHGLFPYIKWAYDTSLITNDLEEAVFSPAEAITEDELIVLLVKALRLETADAPLEYASGYVDKVGAFTMALAGGEDKVLRDKAAQALVEAMWFQDEDTMVDISLLEDDEGNRLDCLVTNVFGLNQIELTVRATKNRPMGFDVEKDVMLSNGYQMDCEDDLSDRVGYSIAVTYCDMDQSGTLTQDEEIISYEVNSSMVLYPMLAALKMTSYANMTFTEIGFDFAITNFTEKYYNDDKWPEAEYGNLIEAAGGAGGGLSILNRPNMQLSAVPDASGLRIQYLFATEKRPGKIVDITGSIYTIRDYYQRGTDNEYIKVDVEDMVFVGSSNAVGDYINFYESYGKYYIHDGSALITKVKENLTGNQLLLESNLTVTPHLYFERNSQYAPIGEEVVVLVDDVTGSYYYGWEFMDEIQPTPVLVKEAFTVYGGVTYVFYNCETKEEFETTILTDNIYAGSEIKVGEFLYYSKDTTGAEKIERAKYTDKVKLGVETEDYFVESSTGRILTKSKSYYGNLYTDTFKEDYYRVYFDIAGNVFALA